MLRHLLLACFGVAALPAWAHDVWLRPVKPEPLLAGELVSVELWQGHRDAPEVLPRNDRRLLRLEAIAPDGRQEPTPGLHGQTPAGVFRPASAGLWTLVYEGHPAPYSLPADRFERYLREEGLEHVITVRERDGERESEGRELVSRSLKSLLSVEGAPMSDRVVGLPVEMVVSAWPGSTGEPSLESQSSEAPAPSTVDILAAQAVATESFEISLFVDGEPTSGVLIDFQRLDDPSAPLLEARTDARGRARFPASEGEWMAAAVVARSIEQERADWRTIFSTLTFTWQP